MPTWTTKPKREPDEEGGFGDFGDDFSKLLENLQPDTIPTGWPRYRRGGSPRNWDTFGNYNFVDPSGFVQIGVYADALETPNTENNVWVYFPMAYSGRPIVFAQIGHVSYPGSYVTWTLYTERDRFNLQWESDYNQDWVQFFWLAFGPGAG